MKNGKYYTVRTQS